MDEEERREEERTNAFERRMWREMRSAQDHLEIVLRYYEEHERLRPRIHVNFRHRGNIQLDEDLNAIGSWSGEVREYRTMPERREWLRERLAVDRLSNRARAVLTRRFNIIDQEAAAARTVRQQLERIEYLEQIEQNYMSANGPETRYELIVTILHLQSIIRHAPTELGQLIANAHSASSFIDVFRLVFPTRRAQLGAILQRWILIRDLVERGYPDVGPMTWQEIYNELDNLVQQDQDVTTPEMTPQEALGLSWEYLDTEADISRDARVVFLGQISDLVDDFPENEELRNRLDELRLFNFNLFYDDEPLQPMDENWWDRIEVVLQGIAQRFDFSEADGFFAQGNRDPTIYFHPAAHQHGPDQLDESDMRNWDPRILEALHLLAELIEDEYDVEHVLRDFERRIRGRMRDNGDTRNFLTYADVLQALEHFVTPDDWHVDVERRIHEYYFPTNNPGSGEDGPGLDEGNVPDGDPLYFLDESILDLPSDVSGYSSAGSDGGVEDVPEPIHSAPSSSHSSQSPRDARPGLVQVPPQPPVQPPPQPQPQAQVQPPRPPRVRRTQLQLLQEAARAAVGAVPHPEPRVTRGGGQPPDGRYAHSQARQKRRRRATRG